MRILLSACFAFFVCACSPNEAPPSAMAQGLEVSDGWAAPSPNGVDVGAGYLVIANGSAAADTLISVSSPRAQSVELHEMSSDGPVMRMRAVPQLAIPPGATVALAPGGMHLMFHDLDHPFAAGEDVPVHLVFEHAGARDATLLVRSRNNGHNQH
jgi:periplasmic copper chaperone A